MKRLPELRDLSVDHHFGLLLARKAKLVASGEDDTPLEEMWKEVEDKFRFDLEPHFKVEETAICPALESHGEHELVQRLLREHQDLREILMPGIERTTTNLAKFGTLLEGHIRFEERELFEVAQKILTSSELLVVAKASQNRRA